MGSGGRAQRWQPTRDERNQRIQETGNKQSTNDPVVVSHTTIPEQDGLGVHLPTVLPCLPECWSFEEAGRGKAARLMGVVSVVSERPRTSVDGQDQW